MTDEDYFTPEERVAANREGVEQLQEPNRLTAKREEERSRRRRWPDGAHARKAEHVHGRVPL